MADGFSFPALPKPKPLEAAGAGRLPSANPLLAGATVIDRSASAAAGAPAPPAATQQAATADGSDAPTDGGTMGGTLGKPVVLTRHQRIAPARKKVPFEKGYSQMDWVRLTQTHPDLAGLGGQRPRRGITMEEVAQHCTQDDCWTVLRGKVYNITHYLRFHPGGVPLLLKVGGKDGTVLFNKYHAWVNHDALLAKCMVGLLAPPSSSGGSRGGGADGRPQGAAAPKAEQAAVGKADSEASGAAVQNGGAEGEGEATDGSEEDEEEQQAAPSEPPVNRSGGLRLQAAA